MSSEEEENVLYGGGDKVPITVHWEGELEDLAPETPALQKSGKGPWMPNTQNALIEEESSSESSGEEVRPGKRRKKQGEDIPYDLVWFFDHHDADDSTRIRMCRAYASYVRATGAPPKETRQRSKA